jgi:putative SOS response-associated peptidase YedK
MCGRYVTPEEAALERHFNLTPRQAVTELIKAFGNFDTRPAVQVPVLRGRTRDVVRLDEQGERELLTMRWGLVPFFAKGVPGPYATFNARMEDLREKPSYRGPWKRGQRCLIPVKAFYEWQAQPPDFQKAVPHYISVLDREVFCLAGLWESSTTADGVELLSCTIITMAANELMQLIHNSKLQGKKRTVLPEADRRMPAILRKEDEETWLRGSADEAWAVLKQYPSDEMRAQPVVGKMVSDRQPELLS